MRVVIMGVSGSGKTSVGQALSRALGEALAVQCSLATPLICITDIPFFDGDDFHPEENVAKMAAGEPLTDSDRWLEWSSMLHGGLEWSTMLHGGLERCTMLHGGFEWCTMHHGGLEWCTMLHGGLEWCTLHHGGLECCIMH
jgi:hypothetical protein